MPQTIIQEDTLDQFIWNRIITTREETGTVLDRRWEYDDGTVKEEQFVEGILSFSRMTDAITNPTANAWMSIDKYYDGGGSLVALETIYDDGTVRIDQFANGLRTQTTQYDSLSAPQTNSWEEIETYYDENGQVLANVTTFDNGTIKEKLYDAGGLTQISLYDPLNAVSWDTIDSYYTDNAELLARVRVMDTGVITEELFENGTISRIQSSDQNDVFGFDMRTTYFDETGQKIAKVTVMDNGVRKEELFEDGQLTQITQNDTNDVKSWDQIDLYFNADGVQAGSRTIADNGIATDVYDIENVLSARIQNDTLDIKNWKSRETNYDLQTGNRSAMEIYFDNNDRRIMVYEEDGQTLDYRVDYDGDQSDPWRVQVTEFDAQGENPEITTYDALYLVPSPYIDALGFVSV